MNSVVKLKGELGKSRKLTGSLLAMNGITKNNLII